MPSPLGVGQRGAVAQGRRRDGAHDNAFVLELGGARHRPTGRSVFGSHVGRLVRDRQLAGERRDVHDSSKAPSSAPGPSDRASSLPGLLSPAGAALSARPGEGKWVGASAVRATFVVAAPRWSPAERRISSASIVSIRRASRASARGGDRGSARGCTRSARGTWQEGNHQRTIAGAKDTNRSNLPNGTFDIRRLRGASILKPRARRWCMATSLIVGTSNEMLSMPRL
jgi:hypothetical protein